VKRAFVVALLGLVGATQLSCNVNDYCLNCGVGDGGNGSGGDGGDGDGNGTGDGGGSGDAGACMPTGPEICDGKDNDCNGFVDDGVVEHVGELCDNQMGACAGGVKQCVAGVLKCTKTPMPEICDNIDNNCNNLVDEGDPGGGGKCGTDVGECVAGTNHCVAGAVQCIGFQDHSGDPELCNLKDDNCNGSFDEGLTNMGACGIKTCVGGTNKGTICQSSADCTGGGTCTLNVGECHQGTLACMGGAPQCDAVQQGFIPHLEICDNKDNDCDGVTDEGFDTTSDVNNCGMCGTQCTVPASFNAFPTCSGSACSYTCKAGYHDLDGSTANGCEYGPCFPSGVEVCDGQDNDCDGLVDAADPDLGAAPNICLSAGACATGTTISCDGASGWTCHYGSNVSKDAMGHIIPETACDHIDNDCNNIVDDHQRPLLDTPCDDGNKGECRSYGTYQCDTVTNTNPAVCVYTHNGVASVPESCDNLDNDCDGVIDNTATPGTFPNGGISWVDIGNGKQMMQYEASKPDATAADSGNVVTNQCGASSTVAANGATEVGTVATFTTTTAHNLAVGRVVVVSGVSVAGYNGTWSVASVVSPTVFTATLPSGLATPGTGGTVSPVCPTCSQASKIPWTNVTYPQAVAACQAIGATLCTEQQWHRTCSVVAPATSPIALGTGTVDTLIEAEDYAAIGAASSHVWAEDYTVVFSGISDMVSSPDNGTSIANGNVIAQAPHLDYNINFQKASSSYHIWVRMWSPNTASGNRMVMNLDGVTPVNNDRFTQNNANVWEWVEREGGALTVTAGIRTMRIYMERDGVKIDAIQIREAAGAPAAPANSKGNTWAYAANPNTYQAMTCNGQDYDPAQDSTLPTGSLASCYANVGTHVFDMSGNVKEWTLARQSGQNPIRGGASNSTDVGTSCSLNFTLGNDAFFFPNVGFRCCR